jgi:hypothetical protein
MENFRMGESQTLKNFRRYIADHELMLKIGACHSSGVSMSAALLFWYRIGTISVWLHQPFSDNEACEFAVLCSSCDISEDLRYF